MADEEEEEGARARELVLPAEVVALCKAVARTRGAQGSLAALAAAVRAQPVAVLERFFELIKFPVWVLVQHAPSEAVRVAALQCLAAVLADLPFTGGARLTAVVTELTMVLDGKLSAGAPLSDEVAQAALDALHAVAHGLAPAAMAAALVRDNFSPALGYALAATLDRFKLSDARAVRVRAAEVLAALCRAVPEPAALRPFLPGVASGLARALAGDHKQGQQVFVAALDAWGAAVVAALDSADDAAVPAAGDAPDENSAPAQLQALLEPLLRNVAAHEAWRVREAAAALCGTLLRNCARTLVYATPTLVETLVLLCSDTYPAVSECAQTLLHEAAATVLSGDAASTALPALLRENLTALITTLPRLVTGTEPDKLRTLRLLRGYIDFLVSLSVFLTFILIFFIIVEEKKEREREREREKEQKERKIDR